MQKAYIPSNPTLGCKSQRNAFKIHYVTFARIFIAALFVFPGSLRQFKCLQQNVTDAHLKLLQILYFRRVHASKKQVSVRENNVLGGPEKRGYRKENQRKILIASEWWEVIN